MADRITGLAAVGAVNAALLHRERTGEGQRVEVPMFETMAGFVLGDHLGGRVFDPPLDAGGYARLLSPGRRPYRTRDGHVCTMIYNDRQWRNFCAAAGLPDLVSEDPRFASHATRTENIDAILAMLERVFAERDTAEWVRVLEEADLPVAPLHTLESIVRDPHLAASASSPRRTTRARAASSAWRPPRASPPTSRAAAAAPRAAPGRARGGGAARGRLRRRRDRGAVRERRGARAGAPAGRRCGLAMRPARTRRPMREHEGQAAAAVTTMRFRPIGVIRTPWATPADCPRNGRQLRPAPVCRVVLRDEFLPGLEGIDGFSHLILLYWLREAGPRAPGVPAALRSLAAGRLRHARAGAAEPDRLVGGRLRRAGRRGRAAGAVPRLRRTARRCST